MALNVKAALLICLAFTGGMCWLVSRVQRPIVEFISPADSGAPAARHVARVAEHTRGRAASPDFARSSPVAPAVHVAAIGAAPPPQAPVHREADALPPAVRPETLTPVDDREARLLIARTTPWPPTIEIPDVVGGEPELADGEATEPVAPPPAATPRTVEIQRGDSLVRICRRLWSSEEPRYLKALIDANPTLRANPNHIVAGQTLVVPLVEEAGAAPRASAPQVAQQNPPPSELERRAAAARYYTVRRDDTLAGIARRELKDARRWSEIARLNGFKDADIIRPGMRIRLPGAPSDG